MLHLAIDLIQCNTSTESLLELAEKLHLCTISDQRNCTVIMPVQMYIGHISVLQDGHKQK